MLIQITNSCRMACSHCLQDSKVGSMHMKPEMFDDLLQFCKKSQCKVINISGGEPTEHPQFEEITRMFVDNFPLVNVLSNGMFIFNKEKTKVVKKLIQKGVDFQITTHKSYYPLYKDICKHRKDFEKLGIVPTVNPEIYIHQLGRATGNKECIEQAKTHPFTTSCMMASTFFWQMPFNTAIAMMELRGHFCTPLIDWQGNIHLSESWLCPNIDNITTFDNFENVVHFKPCGKCPDYQKLLADSSPNYVAVKNMMGIKED